MYLYIVYPINVTITGVIVLLHLQVDKVILSLHKGRNTLFWPVLASVLKSV